MFFTAYLFWTGHWNARCCHLPVAWIYSERQTALLETDQSWKNQYWLHQIVLFLLLFLFSSSSSYYGIRQKYRNKSGNFLSIVFLRKKVGKSSPQSSLSIRFCTFLCTFSIILASPWSCDIFDIWICRNLLGNRSVYDFYVRRKKTNIMMLKATCSSGGHWGNGNMKQTCIFLHFWELLRKQYGVSCIIEKSRS